MKINFLTEAGAVLVAKEVVKVNWEEKVQAKKADGTPDFEFEKIDQTTIKKKVWVVANCTGLTGNLSVQLFENKLTNAELVYKNPSNF